MASYFEDNEDLRFYFAEGVDWARLAEVTEYGYRSEGGFKTAAEATAFYREVAELTGTLVAEEVAPRAAQIDRDGTHLVNGEAVTGEAMDSAFGALRAAELQKLCLPRELGGLNAPLLVYFLTGEMIARGDVSVMA